MNFSSQLTRGVLLLALAATARAQPVPLTVNTASREEVRQFYRAIYNASENIPMGWTGSYTAGGAGDTSAVFKEATRLRTNFFRALAGVPAGVTFNATFSAKNQQAALMMSANNTLDHFPPPSWTFYTAAGAEAAGNSNLAIGEAGPDAVTGYVADKGSNNAVVGHRRWLFYPQTLVMGTGDVPGVPGDNTRSAANSMWILDTTVGGRFGDPRPTTRTTAVAYPPAGYVPYQLVWPRWSFSYPGADMSGVTVTMTRAGQSIAVVPEPLNTTPSGEPTFVWVYNGLNSDNATTHPRPTADTTYVVTVTGMKIGAVTQAPIAYSVTVFDPDVGGSDFSPIAITGSTTPTVGTANPYTASKPAFAGAFDWRSVQLSGFTKTYNAESGFDGLVATTSAGYDVVQTFTTGAGTASYKLAHVNPRSTQTLKLAETVYVGGSSAAIAFLSRLAIATAVETARVQVSTDEGASWTDLYTQTGATPTSGTPTPTENAFVTRTVSLANYVGRTVDLRLAYSIEPSGPAFLPEPNNAVGWFIDNLTLSGVQTVTPLATTRVSSGTAFAVTPVAAGAFALQARGVLFAAYPLEWGSLTQLNATTSGAASNASYLSNLSVRTTAGSGAQTLIVGFAVGGGNKPLLVRGVGPGLAVFGVPGTLIDPKLELYNGSTKVNENDNWLPGDQATFGTVGAFGLPANSKDAALVTSLSTGSYTAQISGVGGTTGLTLVELYDTAGGNGAKLVNVSARTQVGTGGDILISGFNISGTGKKTLLIRAVGPRLGDFGITGFLADPKLELFATNGSAPLASNDNWDATTAPAATQTSVGAFTLLPNSKDAVLLVTLDPGGYTAQVSGVGNTTGVALVEVYEVP